MEYFVSFFHVVLQATFLAPIFLRLFKKWIGSDLVFGRILLWVIFVAGIANFISLFVEMLDGDSLARRMFQRVWGNALETGDWSSLLFYYVPVLIPFLSHLWSRKLRYIFFLSLLSNVTSLFSSFVLLTTTLHRDYFTLPTVDDSIFSVWNIVGSEFIIGGIVLSGFLVFVKKVVLKPKPFESNVLDDF